MKSKIILTYQNEGEYLTEGVWAEKQGDYYKIKNIPFFASNIALDDIVSVEEDEGELYFVELIESSGNSVVQIVFFKPEMINEITKHFEELECGWEGSHLPNLISVNIPKKISYQVIKEYLDLQYEQGILDYKEACLGYK